MSDKIIYTLTDEAPALATHSLLPIIQAFAEEANISVETRDISLAARVLAKFPEYLNENQKVNDALEELGEMAKTPEANIIKLPNISASVPQLTATIKELQEKGYQIPNYPSDPNGEKEEEIKSRYDKIKGSAVNPVLREGNSDRRAPKAVKEFAKKNPHRMGSWSAESKSHVASMTSGDFYSNEKSVTIENATNARIEFLNESGEIKVLKEGIALQLAEVIDGTFMSKKALLTFLRKEIAACKEEGILFSLHMKATMMKVSDPIIFGHVVKVFFEEVFNNNESILNEIGANPNDGLGNVIKSLEALNEADRLRILGEIDSAILNGPELAMVDSDNGITNLHVPSDVIIDASMPAMIRNSGKMWDKAGNTQDTKAIIPDNSYAKIYAETIQFCKENGAFDPTTMGTVPNVGLMAQKAEEYGSHDKTFEIQENGTVQVVDDNGQMLISHEVEAGDIWRMCQVKDAPVRNWVELAVERATATAWPAVFWLDENRSHDAELIKKVNTYLKDLNTDGLDIRILAPAEATRFTLERIKAGENTISVTGNVLRDYLTDLFPILELGTSAKMLSIVPLMNGGGLFETGAGGSAPKHVQQFNKENHLRWDSLGEFLALAVSFEHLANRSGNTKAKILADCLDQATENLLMNGKSPSRKVQELDNRGSHFYLAKYWAEALSNQDENNQIRERFQSLSSSLNESETNIIEELNSVQGQSMDIDGYYFPNSQKTTEAMRPSKTLNEILSGF